MASSDKKPEQEKKKEPSQGTVLVENVARDVTSELFHSADGSEYVSLGVNNHRETYFIKSTTFRHYLRRLFLSKNGKAPGAAAINDAVNMCGALAANGPIHEVALRVGEYGGAL